MQRATVFELPEGVDELLAAVAEALSAPAGRVLASGERERSFAVTEKEPLAPEPAPPTLLVFRSLLREAA